MKALIKGLVVTVGLLGVCCLLCTCEATAALLAAVEGAIAGDVAKEEEPEGDPVPAEVKLVAPDGEAGFEFGGSVAITDEYAIVGSVGDNHAGGYAGSAHVFGRVGPNAWDTGAKIVPADAATESFFGCSVSISGDYAIVGASGDSEGGAGAGSAYVFRRTGPNTWDAGVKLTASDAAAEDRFGNSVGISGDYAIVGANGDDLAGDFTGSAYVFRRTGPNNVWDAGTKLTAMDAASGDFFGRSVSISGDYAIVGAWGGDSDAIDTGTVYAFHRTGLNDWDDCTKLAAVDAATSDRFGVSVSIFGDYAIVGAPQNDDYGESSGSAYVFRRTGVTSWDAGVKLGADDASAGDRFGGSVSISRDYALVGASSDSERGDLSGSAYVFRRIGANAWDSGTKLLATDGSAEDYFGVAVSVSDTRAIIGAYRDDDRGMDCGSAYVHYFGPQ